MFIDASEVIRIQNVWFGKCLSHDGVSGSIPVARDCNPNDATEEWRWIDYLVLKNIHSGLCLQRFTTSPVFRMQNCDLSLKEQHFICVFNFIKALMRPGAPLCFVNPPLELSACQDLLVYARWKVYGASSEESVCSNPGMQLFF